MTILDSGSQVFVAGHTGLVGAAIVRRLEKEGVTGLILRSRSEVDLTDRGQTNRLFDEERPEFVFLAAARVGGILANQRYPGDFIRENLEIQVNVVEAARKFGVRKLLFLGSSCIYPRDAPQPMREEHLLTGPLEPTNEPYALAKIAGIRMCQAYWRQFECHFISLMPTNLYGPGDNFDLEQSHVIPALIRKCHEAKENGDEEVVVWGTGTPRREFLYVDDLADACMFLMRNYDAPEIVNVGVGKDISIREVAELVASVVGFEGHLTFEDSRPDGAPRKLLDVGRLHSLGWQAEIGLRDGLERTYRCFRDSSWTT